MAYLTVLSHQGQRRRQCDALRANSGVLHALALSDPIGAARLAESSPPAAVQELYYPSRPKPPTPAARAQASFVEELKSRWNAEVEGAVRRVQTTDWVGLREDAEAMASHLLSVVTNSAAEERVASVAASAKAEVQDLASSAQAKASEAVAKGKEVLAAAGVSGPGGVAKLQAGSGISEAAAATAQGTPTDVEVALQHRYAKGEDEAMKKSVGELLEERYKHKA